MTDLVFAALLLAASSLFLFVLVAQGARRLPKRACDDPA